MRGIFSRKLRAPSVARPHEPDQAMSNIIQILEQEAVGQRAHPSFAPGDTLVVNVKVKEGNRERVQAFEGVVVGIRKRGLNSAFTVRKISHGTGVERVFQTHSPSIDSIQVKRRGAVRAAKLYYLRDLEGKAARIKEKLSPKTKVHAPAPAPAPVASDPA